MALTAVSTVANAVIMIILVSGDVPVMRLIRFSPFIRGIFISVSSTSNRPPRAVS